VKKYVYLFSTSHCHLCETAEALIVQLGLACELAVIEIADDDDLLIRYGLKIPVLQRQDTKAELNWPFTTTDIIQFLK
jgi:glutaredoxin 2